MLIHHLRIELSLEGKLWVIDRHEVVDGHEDLPSP